MPDLISQPAEIRFTLEITRAATGLKETVEMVGHVIPQLEPQAASESEYVIEGASK
jgi:hypothetical protein